MPDEFPTRPCSKCHGTGIEMDPVQTGLQLRERRKAAGKSLRSVAKAMGFKAPYLSDLERGNRSFSVALIEKYLEALQ